MIDGIRGRMKKEKLDLDCRTSDGKLVYCDECGETNRCEFTKKRRKTEMKKEGKWTFNSVDEGLWSNDVYDTKEEAIAAAKRDGLSIFFVGRIELMSLPQLNIAEEIIERLTEHAFEECGEAAENWICDADLNDIQQLDDAINDVIKEWLKDNALMPDFYKLTNIEEIQELKEN